MFETIHQNEWISSNGKWKVSVEVKENNGIFISDIRVFSFIKENIWKNEGTNMKLPKYVAAKLQKARDLVDGLRKEKVTQ